MNSRNVDSFNVQTMHPRSNQPYSAGSKHAQHLPINSTQSKYNPQPQVPIVSQLP
jgi:hypothetical protein